MKHIRKVYLRGSSYPRYVGKDIVSSDCKKVLKFVGQGDQRLEAVEKILKVFL